MKLGSDLEKVNWGTSVATPAIPRQNNAVSGDERSSTEASRGRQRVAALDFSKGLLVVIMVLYHWMNYFLSVDGSVYKYLRFLTPSFIFITGFLISHVYGVRYRNAPSRVTRRLLIRGFKLLFLVAILDVLQSTITDPHRAHRIAAGSFLQTSVSCLVGTQSPAFSVLYPIAYLLVCAALLFYLSRFFRHALYVATFLVVVVSAVAEWERWPTGYLQIFSLGLVGMIVGRISLDRLQRDVVGRGYLLLMGYTAYLAVVTIWDVSYPVQLVGVSLTLGLIYALAVWSVRLAKFQEVMVLLGQYSLYGYIAQIIILQVLRRTTSHYSSSVAWTDGALIVALFLTILSVQLIAEARTRLASVDRVYRIVFC